MRWRRRIFNLFAWPRTGWVLLRGSGRGVGAGEAGASFVQILDHGIVLCRQIVELTDDFVAVVTQLFEFRIGELQLLVTGGDCRRPVGDTDLELIAFA